MQKLTGKKKLNEGLVGAHQKIAITSCLPIYTVYRDLQSYTFIQYYLHS